MSRAWRLVSRASCSVVRFERAGQGGVNSGRAVATKQHARRRALRDQAPEQLQRRGVAPVQVLDEQHQRLRSR